MTARSTLDKLALRLQQMPNAKLEVVGYTDEKEAVSEQTLAHNEQSTSSTT
jgi:outer membrane protein OmpA-like peptidoglycan-associated protein